MREREEVKGSVGIKKGYNANMYYETKTDCHIIIYDYVHICVYRKLLLKIILGHRILHSVLVIYTNSKYQCETPK